MGQVYKVLAQSNPAANTLTQIYTVPANTSTTISSIIICNIDEEYDAVFRVSVQVGGSADNKKQYIYYDLPLINNDTYIATIGLTLAAGDVVAVRANTTNLAFSLYGVEIS